MEKEVDFIINLNKKNFENNKDILFKVINSLKEIIINIENDKEVEKIENIINILNKLLIDSKKKLDMKNKSLEELKLKIKKNININKEANSKKVEEQFFTNGKYIGETLNGKRHGKGIYFFNNGDIYTLIFQIKLN